MGQFLENSTSVFQRMATRNLDLWNSMSQRLRRGQYTANDMAADSAKSLAIALNNLNDVWALLTRPPAAEREAAVVPTAFMFFDRQGEVHVLVDPVYISVPEHIQFDRRDLPETALIALDGTATPPGDSVQGVTALLARMRPRLSENKRAYVLENYNPGGDVRLVPGVYDGLVSLTKPPLPLANLRVVVEGDPRPPV